MSDKMRTHPFLTFVVLLVAFWTIWFIGYGIAQIGGSIPDGGVGNPLP